MKTEHTPKRINKNMKKQKTPEQRLRENILASMRSLKNYSKDLLKSQSKDMPAAQKKAARAYIEAIKVCIMIAYNTTANDKVEIHKN